MTQCRVTVLSYHKLFRCELCRIRIIGFIFLAHFMKAIRRRFLVNL